MACNSFEYTFGTMEKSYINPLIFAEKVKFVPKANNTVYMEQEDIDKHKCKDCYDIKSSYYNGVLEYFPSEVLPVYDGRENIEDYCGGDIRCGEYFCDWYGEIACVFKNHWVSNIVVKSLLKKGLFEKKHIIKQHLANRVVSTDSIMKFA